MLKGIFAIDRLVYLDELSSELKLKLANHIIDYSLDKWGLVDEQTKQNNEQTLSNKKGTLVGKYQIDDCFVIIKTDYNEQIAYISFAEQY